MHSDANVYQAQRARRIMDIQSLLHRFPHNIIIAALLGALLFWIFGSWFKRRALRRQREESEAAASKMRLELTNELDAKNDEIAHLQTRLMEADHLTKNLSQKAAMLPQEQQRFADLKDRYLSDVSRARNLLKTRGDASSELQRRNQESTERYNELHARWDTERKRYAKLVTEKNQHIADLESRVEGLESSSQLESESSQNSYSNGQLETMLVELRQQVSDRDAQIQGLQHQVTQAGTQTASGTADSDIQNQLRMADAKMASKDREIARLRNQLIKESSGSPQAVQMLGTSTDRDTGSTLMQADIANKEAELSRLRLEVESLKPAAAKLRRLETKLQHLARGGEGDEENATLRALELELEQLQSKVLQQQAEGQLSLEKQANAFQQQLNAKTDAIGRLNRQLQASRLN